MSPAQGTHLSQRRVVASRSVHERKISKRRCQLRFSCPALLGARSGTRTRAAPASLIRSAPGLCPSALARVHARTRPLLPGSPSFRHAGTLVPTASGPQPSSATARKCARARLFHPLLLHSCAHSPIHWSGSLAGPGAANAFAPLLYCNQYNEKDFILADWAE